MNKIIMNKTACKIMAALMCMVTVAGYGTVEVSAKTNNAVSIIDKLMEDTEVEASERIYVMADESGNPYKVMASVNDENAKTIDDKDGLPIKVTASYTLDGKKITASEIEGSTGKLKIRYDFENTKETEIKVDGKTEKAHVPFVVTTGLVVDQNEYKNIKVSNGKVTKDGNSAIIAGIAYPSLSEDLQLKDEDMKIYDYVEIEADVENASWSNVYIIVSNNVFSALGDSKDNNDEDNKIGQLIGGINELDDGSKQLAEGLGQLSEGTEKINSGVDSLSAGLGSLSQNSGKLNMGAKQVFDSLLATANVTLAQSGANLPALTADNYEVVLGGAINLMTLSGDSASVASLTKLKGQLDAYNTFYKGLMSYTAGVDKAYEGSKKLNSSMPEYVEGVNTLKDGAEALSDGMDELSEKTVGGLTNDDNAKNVLDRFKLLSEVSEKYVSYVDDTAKDGRVCFIYKMDK